MPLPSKTPRPSGSPAPGISPKEFAETIYKRLVRVTGDGRQAPPLDVVPDARRSSDRQVAWFDPGARKIGIDEKTVKSRLYEGRQQLRTLLKDLEDQ